MSAITVYGVLGNPYVRSVQLSLEEKGIAGAADRQRGGDEAGRTSDQASLRPCPTRPRPSLSRRRFPSPGSRLPIPAPEW
jgi:hypothetical protein